METNDREKLANTIADAEKCFQEHGYYPTTYVPRKGGNCYHSSSERTILRDIQHGSVPDGTLLKSCCWSKICWVRQKYGHKVGVRSETWRELCHRMGSIRSRRQSL